MNEDMQILLLSRKFGQRANQICNIRTRGEYEQKMLEYCNIKNMNSVELWYILKLVFEIIS